MSEHHGMVIVPFVGNTGTSYLATCLCGQIASDVWRNDLFDAAKDWSDHKYRSRVRQPGIGDNDDDK